MRFVAVFVLVSFLVAVTGSLSWADKVLCVHPGDVAGYVHIEKSDLADNSVGELHVSLSPDSAVGSQVLEITHIFSHTLRLPDEPEWQPFDISKSTLSHEPLPQIHYVHLKTIRLLI